MTVIIDADACPKGALAIIEKYRVEYAYEIVTISSFNHLIISPCHITVGDGQDEADLAVANRVKPGDIVVTQDWGLASLVLAREGKALSPKGLVFTNDNITQLLEERHIKAKLRRQGGHTKGPKARTSADDQKFEAAFRRLLLSQQGSQ